MLIKTVKDFERHLKETDTCSRCGKRLIAPPVVTVDQEKYHLNCARNLAYAIFFDLIGEPDRNQVAASDESEKIYKERSLRGDDRNRGFLVDQGWSGLLRS